MPEDIKSGTIYMIIAFIVSAFAGYGTHVIIARTLGPEDYGAFGVLVSYITIAVTLGAGIPNSMLVFISRYEADNNRKGVYSTIKSGFALQVALTLVFIVVTISLKICLKSKLFGESAILVLVFLLAVISKYFYGISSGIIQGFREQKALGIIEGSQSIFYLILVLLVLSTFQLGLKGVVGAYVSISLLLCLAGIIIVRLMLSDRSEKSRSMDIANVIRFAVPSTLITIFDSIMMRSAPILVKALIDGESDSMVGYAVVVFSLASIPDRAIRVIFRSSCPHIARWHIQEGMKSLDSYMHRMILAIICACVLFTILAHFLARPIVQAMYGNTYIPVSKYAIPTIAAFGAISVANMYKTFMYSAGQPSKYLYLSFAGLVAYISGIYIFSRIFDPVMSVVISIGCSYFLISVGAIIMKNTILVTNRGESK